MGYSCCSTCACDCTMGRTPSLKSVLKVSFSPYFCLLPSTIGMRTGEPFLIGRQALISTHICWHLDPGLPRSMTVRISVCCVSQPAMVLLLYQPECTKTVILTWFVFRGDGDQRSGWLRGEKLLEEQLWEPYSRVCRASNAAIS